MSQPASRPLIFGLDIGTRSVVGLIIQETDNGYHVVDVFSQEHTERSMLDGQIHNVLEVAKSITYVKEQLEAKHGTLRKVCVAAAGRSLKTVRATEELDITGKPIFDRESLLTLELSAVQKAQFKLASSDAGSHGQVNDYCVGYSVIDYHLDEQKIGSLVDQKGHKAAVEVIATFLPKVVVESLIAALHRADLSLEALTLEPIAAINVLIPQSMRRLNVALVDIGAGTSDIAITDYGTVTAYGMVPNAGDEITEAISDQFLLDFPDAEHVKRQLNDKDEVLVQDILGMETSMTRDDIITPVQPAINHLADQISAEILNLNGRIPKAVMLVGGGSLTPLLPEKIAERLELPANRVAIRGIDAIKSLTFEQEFEPTPELVTPIGIAIAARENPVEYISIRVNEETVRLFDIKKLTVGDGVVSSGVELNKLFGKPGMAIMVKVNGRVVSIPGQHGTPPNLLKNGEICSLDDPLSDGDVIHVEKGKSGKDAVATASDVLDIPEPFTIELNGDALAIEPKIQINGQSAKMDDVLHDRDQLDVHFPENLEEVLQSPGIHTAFQQAKTIEVTVNHHAIRLQTKQPEYRINGETSFLTSTVKQGDTIKVNGPSQTAFTIEDVLLQQYDYPNREILVTFNDEPVRLEKALFDCTLNGEPAALHTSLSDGDTIELKERQNVSFIFQDVFAKVQVKKPSVSDHVKPVILQNDQETSFSAPINHGDQLKLNWH